MLDVGYIWAKNEWRDVRLWTLELLGLAKPNQRQEGIKALMRGVKTSISVSRCRENPDCAAIFPRNLPRQRERLGAWTHVRGRVGLGVNPDHPQPKTRTGCGWGKGGNTKGGSAEVKSSPLLLAPPTTHFPLPPTYFIRRKLSEECRLLRENFKLAELQIL